MYLETDIPLMWSPVDLMSDENLSFSFIKFFIPKAFGLKLSSVDAFLNTFLTHVIWNCEI